MKLYICSIEELSDAASYDAASLKIDLYRKEKLDGIKGEKDRRRSLCAGLLLNYAVAEYKYNRKSECGVPRGVKVQTIDNPVSEGLEIIEVNVQKLLRTKRQEYDYKQIENGKPYISGMPDFHFSISHSGDYALCVWDFCEIGADLQCMDREIRNNLARKFLTEKEYKRYAGLSGQEQKKEFYRVWAIKESFCKLTGKGLSENFHEIETENIFYMADLWKENYWLAVSRYGSKI